MRGALVLLKLTCMTFFKRRDHSESCGHDGSCYLRGSTANVVDLDSGIRHPAPVPVPVPAFDFRFRDGMRCDRIIFNKCYCAISSIK